MNFGLTQKSFDLLAFITMRLEYLTFSHSNGKNHVILVISLLWNIFEKSTTNDYIHFNQLMMIITPSAMTLILNS